jgi:hypothetical protein
MKVTFIVRDLRTRNIREKVDLKLGEYNEFYLPSIDLDCDAQVRIGHDDGDVTVLHLKR